MGDTLVVIPITSPASAGEAITIPFGIKLKRIAQAVRIQMSDGTDAGECSTLTVTTGTPSGNQIALSSDGRSVSVGVNLTTRDILVVYGTSDGEAQGYGDGTAGKV